jgi:hypothetical protein
VDDETRKKRIECMHKNHDWMAMNELKHGTICRRCGLDRSENQEEIYHIPHLVRREVGYANRKDYY